MSFSNVKVSDAAVVELVAGSAKIQIDVGCGEAKRPGWVGMDIRPLEGVDVVHDVEDFPWPFPDGCARVIQLSHILEHVPPVGYRLEVTRGWEGGILANAVTDVKLHRTKPLLLLMDELHRILEPGGQAWITGPYGVSHGFVQDPTHAKPINEDFFEYFTPQAKTCAPSGLYRLYKPKPWAWVTCEYDLGGNMIVVLRTLAPAGEPEVPGA